MECSTSLEKAILIVVWIVVLNFQLMLQLIYILHWNSYFVAILDFYLPINFLFSWISDIEIWDTYIKKIPLTAIV
mgnify:CR=1 FL=1